MYIHSYKINVFARCAFLTRKPEKVLHYGVHASPNRKFVWNNYLLSKMEGVVNNEWILHIMHGFISQSNVSIFGRPIYITLIARRSNKYAGTRFLKRGANKEVTIICGWLLRACVLYCTKFLVFIGRRCERSGNRANGH